MNPTLPSRRLIAAALLILALARPPTFNCQPNGQRQDHSEQHQHQQQQQHLDPEQDHLLSMRLASSFMPQHSILGPTEQPAQLTMSSNQQQQQLTGAGESASPMGASQATVISAPDNNSHNHNSHKQNSHNSDIPPQQPQQQQQQQQLQQQPQQQQQHMSTTTPFAQQRQQQIQYHQQQANGANQQVHLAQQQMPLQPQLMSTGIGMSNMMAKYPFTLAPSSQNDHSIVQVRPASPQHLEPTPAPATSAMQQPQPQPQPQPLVPLAPLASYPDSYHHQPSSPLYLGHNPFLEHLQPLSYANDNVVTLNLSHSHIYEIDSDAFVGQRFEHIDLSNNKLGLIHSRSFRIGPNHSRHSPFSPHSNSSRVGGAYGPTRRPPPAHPKSVTIDFSHNPAIVALSGAFDHIDVPNCLLNFTNSTVELKFGAFKKYFKEHPGHLVDVDSVDCCEQEWLLGYKHNFVARTHCEHDPNLFLSKVPQQTIIDSCIAYVTSARHSMTIQGPSIIHQVAAAPRSHSNSHPDNQYLTYLILGGTAMILTSLSIYIIFYMFSLKAAFVYQMQTQKS